MSINVQAFRSFHFRKFNIVTDVRSSELVAVLEKEIIIEPKAEIQTLPDWVKDDELFDMAMSDGTLREVNFVEQKKKPTIDNRPKVNITGIPRAQLADPNEGAKIAETGKGFDANAQPLTGQVAAGSNWPKEADKNNSGLAG